MAAYPLLFSPLRVGGVELRNRIVQTGHVTGMAQDGVPGPDLQAYYRERAAGGVALIIGEAGSVHPTAKHMASMVKLYEDPIIDAYRAFVPELHALGTRFVAQLWHSGNNTESMVTDREAWAPSAVAGVLNHEIAHAVSATEIQELVAAYAAAAARALRGGCDGVELHAGHGYIPQQFMSPITNKRTDAYGGSLENRLRFTVETLAALREALGPEPILGLRVSGEEGSPGGLDLAQNVEIARRLVDTGHLSYVSVSFGNYSNMEVQIAPMGLPLGHLAHLAGAVREAVPGMPVIAVGRLHTPDVAEQVLREGQADLIGMARGLVADPEFARKAQAGEAERIRPCVATNYCQSRMWFGRQLSCIYNPVTGRELELGGGTLQPAAVARDVLVVGGGPAGLEAARVAALRGHRVVLHERADGLGGQLRLASHVASRREMRGIVDWLAGEVGRLGVEVRLGSEVAAATAAEVARAGGAVVVATGSQARTLGFNAARSDLPGIPGIETAHAVTGRAALEQPEAVGARVLVVDFEGHVQGLSVVEHLLDLGRAVELVTFQPQAGFKIGATSWVRLLRDVSRKGGVVTPSTVVDRVEGRTVHLVDRWSGRAIVREGVDTVVVIGDTVADDGLAGALAASGVAFAAAGDCVAPRHLDSAVLEGHRAGRTV